MATIELRFDMEETVTSVGRVLIDQDELTAFMGERGITTLTIHDLGEFLDDQDIEVDQVFPNVTSVTKSGIRAGESTPNLVTVPLHQEPGQ